MYCLLAIIGLFNFVHSFVLPYEKDAVILSYEYENYGRGNYYFRYVTSNGIERNETGQLMNEGKDNEHIVVKGQYSYKEPDGQTRSVQYTADANGYRAIFKPISTTIVEENLYTLNDRFQSLSPQVLASLLGG